MSDREWQPCPKCQRYLIPYDNGKTEAVCYGPSFEHVPHASWFTGRYGILRWTHMTLDLAIDIDMGNMNPDPGMIDPWDVRAVKAVRTWAAWRTPRQRTHLPKAAIARIGTAEDLEEDDG